eukprot:4736718-Ditylum_brightwellii.AAC.1
MKKKEKHDALKYLMFLTKKRCGRIKGRECADGKKRFTTHRDDASSLTVSTAALLLNCTINVKEGHGVTTLDAPNAFMQTDMDELVNMKIEGSIAEMLVKINPKLYREYLRAKNGKPVMYGQLKKALYDGKAATPAANHLFSVDAKAEKLNEEQAKLAHHNIANLIFLCQCACPNIQTSLAFLSTQVKHPNVDDMKKLITMIHYLHATRDIPLTLKEGSLHRMRWWIDALFAMHLDMQSHTRDIVMMGKGAIFSTLTK